MTTLTPYSYLSPPEAAALTITEETKLSSAINHSFILRLSVRAQDSTARILQVQAGSGVERTLQWRYAFIFHAVRLI